MGLLDFLKKKELLEIARLKEKCSQFEKFSDIINLKVEVDKLSDECCRLNSDINTLVAKKEIINKLIERKKKELIELNDNILLQDFGMYNPVYDLGPSEFYKQRLEEIREKQKMLILGKSAAICNTQWTVDGSRAKGISMTNQNIKQVLRCFNSECDILISKVKFNNIESFTSKIRNAYLLLNKLNRNNNVMITEEYLDLKLEELKLSHEYKLKKQEEKEEARRIRDELKEEAKLQKEIEEARKDINKEINHYNNVLSKLVSQIEGASVIEKGLLIERKNEIESHISELKSKIEDIDFREANKRAGYVYIISNIGSFGKDVYKIGMTRRLDPMERIYELGDASVPFQFDVHALIFSEDAPKLEAALHHAFENKKVNMVNNRREFFNVTIDEIEEVVKNNYDKTVEFIKIPQAEQYRESLKIRLKV